MIKKITLVDNKKHSPIVKGAGIGAASGLALGAGVSAKFISELKHPISQHDFILNNLQNSLSAKECWKQDELEKIVANINKNIQRDYKTYTDNLADFASRVSKSAPKAVMIFGAMTAALGAGIGTICKVIKKDK